MPRFSWSDFQQFNEEKKKLVFELLDDNEGWSSTSYNGNYINFESIIRVNMHLSLTSV